jgi:hypothetical protein
MGIKQVLSAPRSPWQRACAERLIATILGPHQPGIRCAGLLTPPPFGAKNWCLLLRLANEHHTLLTGELLSLFGRDIVFALAFAKHNYRDLLALGEILQSRHERLADGVHQSAGDELMAAMEAEKTGHALLPL